MASIRLVLPLQAVVGKIKAVGGGGPTKLISTSSGQNQTGTKILPFLTFAPEDVDGDVTSDKLRFRDVAVDTLFSGRVGVLELTAKLLGAECNLEINRNSFVNVLN